MNYWFLFGFVAASWVIAVLIGIWFNQVSNERFPEYKKAVVDHANNILFYGIGAIVGIFLGGLIGNVGKYIIFGIIVILALMCFVPYLIAVFLTIGLSIAEKGQGLHWIVLLSRTVEEFSFIYLAYVMFTCFFM